MTQSAEERQEAVDRQLTLLWQPPEPSARGPRRSLSLDEVVAGAIRLADAGGIDALSMRKVAAELGIGAMSVYTYVPGRDELIELMVDRASDHMELPPAEGPWRPRVRAWAIARHDLYTRHGWMLEASATRDVLGPHAMATEESLFSALRGTGLTARALVGTANAMEWFCRGAAGTVVGEAAATRRTGQTTDQYYEARAGFWTTFFRWEQFPEHVRLWEAGAFEDAEGFDFVPNLEAFLDGIAARTR